MRWRLVLVGLPWLALALACSGAPPAGGADFEATDGGKRSTSSTDPDPTGTNDTPDTPSTGPAPAASDGDGGPRDRGANASGCTDATLPTPDVAFGGGPLVSNAHVYNIGWGTVTNGSALNTFTEWLVTDAASPLRLLSEYGHDDVKIGLGSFGGGQKYGFAGQKYPTDPAAKVTDAEIVGLIADVIAHDKAPDNDDGKQIYAVYLAPGVNVDVKGTSTCTAAMRGYHASTGGAKPRYYVVVPDCGGGMEGQTRIVSREILAAITDPSGEGWADRSGAAPLDVTDLCTKHDDKSHKVADYAVECLWSNASRSCQ